DELGVSSPAICGTPRRDVLALRNAPHQVDALESDVQSTAGTAAGWRTSNQPNLIPNLCGRSAELHEPAVYLHQLWSKAGRDDFDGSEVSLYPGRGSRSDAHVAQPHPSPAGAHRADLELQTPPSCSRLGFVAHDG